MLKPMTSLHDKSNRSPALQRVSRRAVLVTLGRGASFAALAALVNCDNLDNFDVTVAGNGVVPKGTIVDQLLNIIAIDGFDSIDLSAEFKNQGVTKDDVDSVAILSFTLEIVSPASANFDFLTSIAFFAEADGSPRAKIAELTSVPAGQRSIALNLVSGVELKPYVVAPSMRIAAEVSGERPPEDTEVKAVVTLDVDVTVPGC